MATSNEGFSNSHCDNNGFILGVDIGTTTIKAALVNYNSKQTVAHQNIEHCAGIESERAASSDRHEQFVDKILIALNKCIKQLPDDKLQRVKDIVVCGQMHGCVLWKKETICALLELNMEDKLEQIGNSASNLITWEDERCSPEFLSSLPESSPMTPLASGFGCATLFWLQKQTPEVLTRYDSAGTIMDLVVSCLCSSDTLFMSSQNACSWGYFNVDNDKWELEKLTPEDFPTHLLPQVCRPGQTLGRLSQSWFGIPPGATVKVALGDMQCSILATSPSLGDAVLNIGTSTQLSIMVNETLKELASEEVLVNPALHLVPYFGNSQLVVAAAITGGNALAFFVKMLQSWVTDLGLEKPCSEVIYKKLSECSELEEDHSRLTISPVLWGERCNPKQKALVTDITCGSLSLGNVYRSLCHGLVANVASMMNSNFLEKCMAQKIIGTGNALIRNPALQQAVQDNFNLTFVLCENADASVGAALSGVL